MRKRAIGFDTARRLAQGLPDVEEGTTWGTPALKIKGKMFACIPSHKSAEPESLAVRVSFEQRDALLAAQPDVYYVKAHYVGYTVVLVRLNRIHPDALKDLLRSGWRFVSSSTPKRRPSAARPRRPITTKR